MNDQIKVTEENFQAPNPFSPERLALRGNPDDLTDGVGVRRALVKVAVRKPNRQEFIRIHPDPAYRVQMAILEIKHPEKEIYAVTPDIALAIPGETRPVTLTTSINRQDVLFLWPVPLSHLEEHKNNWYPTARDAAERAAKKWIRVISNMSAGMYDVWEMQTDIAEPEWPDHKFEKILEIAFGNGRLIDREDHPVLQQLLGRT